MDTRWILAKFSFVTGNNEVVSEDEELFEYRKDNLDCENIFEWIAKQCNVPPECSIKLQLFDFIWRWNKPTIE